MLTLQDQVFVGLAMREGEDTRELSRRDLTELMERLHAIPSATDFRAFVMMRNRLAHLYPEDPARPAANLNAATEPLAVIATKEGAKARFRPSAAGQRWLRRVGATLAGCAERRCRSRRENGIR